MKALKKFPRRILSNFTVIAEEREGYAREFTQRHRTFIKNPEVRRQIQKASILEIIS